MTDNVIPVPSPRKSIDGWFIGYGANEEFPFAVFRLEGTSETERHLFECFDEAQSFLQDKIDGQKQRDIVFFTEDQTP